MAWLLDTNVLSDVRKLRPHPKVLAFINQSSLQGLYISAVTIAELRFGIELLLEGSKKQDLTHWLASTIRPMFYRRTLPLTEDIMLRWRLMIEVGRKAGYTFAQPDLLIAATAAQLR